jgi:hypothetical protein
MKNSMTFGESSCTDDSEEDAGHPEYGHHEDLREVVLTQDI